MDSVEFIQAVWTELEATGPTDFARKLGLGPDGLQKVRRWRKGGRLDYEDVMLMLQKAGWEPPVGAAPPAGGLARLEDVVAALAARVDRLSGQVEDLSRRAQPGTASGGGGSE